MVLQCPERSALGRNWAGVEIGEALHHLRVLEGLPEADTTQPAGFNLRGYRQELEDAARERLAAAIPDATRQFCVIEEIVVSGKPYREILRLAESRLAELIVLGVRGRGALDLMVFGSTVQQVARQATCPVLTLGGGGR